MARSLFGSGKRTSRYWMVCDNWRETPCLFDEETGLRRGDPPRCIRHGALLFSDVTLNGLSREAARKELQRRWSE